MQDSYFKNYFKIYLWQGISLVLNFLSLFIVVPYLTSEPTTYGIYTVCISISIFLSYADLGFIGAGQKYAAEYFARGERDAEMKVIGFTNFILFIFLLLLSICFLFLSFRPELLIKNLVAGTQETIASSLLLILALFTPITLLQRLLQMIFGIRLEDYIVQRANIVASLLKIISVFWFFRRGEYDIVGYFLFTQIINFFAAISSLIIAKYRYNYDFKKLLTFIHFDKSVYTKTKNLAFTSLYLTLSWILYYELDPAAIGKLLGAKEVAIFAIGLTIMSFFRSLLGILFSPFAARFNHFVGMRDEVGLKALFNRVTILVAPPIIIILTTFCLMAKPLILSWVGVTYLDSVGITQFLILCNIYAFISYPTSLLLMAKERVKEMYVVNTLIPIIYWFGIGLTYQLIGVHSFAMFKFVAFTMSAIAFFIIAQRYLNLSIGQLFQQYINPVILPILLLFTIAFFLTDYLPSEKSIINLIIVAASIGCMIVSSLALVFLFSPYFKNQSKKAFALMKNR